MESSNLGSTFQPIKSSADKTMEKTETPSEGKVSALTSLFESKIQEQRTTTESTNTLKPSKRLSKPVAKLSQQTEAVRLKTLPKPDFGPPPMPPEELPSPDHLGPPPEPPKKEKNIESQVKNSGLSSEQKKQMLSGLSRLKGNEVGKFRSINLTVKNSLTDSELQGHLVNSFTLLKPEEQTGILDGLAARAENAKAAEKQDIVNLMTKLSPEKTDPAPLPKPLFSEEKGLTVEEHTKSILGTRRILQRKKHQRNVKNFANMITNQDIKRLQSIRTPGDLFPIEKTEAGKQLTNDTDFLSNYITYSILSQNNLKDAGKIYKFYVDVAKELEKQGNLDGFRGVVAGLATTSVSRIVEKSGISQNEMNYIKNSQALMTSPDDTQKYLGKFADSDIKTFFYHRINGDVEFANQSPTFKGKIETLGKVLKPFMASKKRADELHSAETPLKGLKVPDRFVELREKTVQEINKDPKLTENLDVEFDKRFNKNLNSLFYNDLSYKLVPRGG